MTFDEFKIVTEKEFRKNFTDVKTETIYNNNTVKTGIIIGNANSKECEELVIYIEDMFETFQKSGNELVCKILNSYIEKCQEILKEQTMHNLDFYIRKDFILSMTIPQLVDYEKSKLYIEEKQIPYYRWNDLAVIPRMINLDFGNGDFGSIIITKDILEKTDLTEIELWESVNKQVNYELSDSYCISVEKSNPLRGFVSNAEKYYGANVLLAPHIFKQLAEVLDCDLFILPASIHAVIIQPYDAKELEGIKEKVKYTNENLIMPELVLSNTIYKYERSLNKIIML